MSEFLFKNLSVKLTPQADETDGGTEMCVDRTTNIECGPGHTCGGELLSTPLVPNCGWCTLCTFQTCDDNLTNFVIQRGTPDEFLAEVRAHKEQLQRVIGHLEERERQIESGGMPQTVEETDRLRAELVAAIEQLDEHRARLQSPPASATESDAP